MINQIDLWKFKKKKKLSFSEFYAQQVHNNECTLIVRQCYLTDK